MYVDPQPDSQFGPLYKIGPIRFSRNHPVGAGFPALYHMHDNSYNISWTLSDEEMQELFMAYLACRQEYEDGDKA